MNWFTGIVLYILIWWVTLFAVLLGTGGMLSQPSGDAVLFTLSMPASRRRLLGLGRPRGSVNSWRSRSCRHCSSH